MREKNASEIYYWKNKISMRPVAADVSNKIIFKKQKCKNSDFNKMKVKRKDEKIKTKMYKV